MRRPRLRQRPDKLADVGVALVDLSLQTIAADDGANSILSAAYLEDRPRRLKRVGALTQLPVAILDQLSRVNLAAARQGEMRFVVGGNGYLVRMSLMAPLEPPVQEPCILVQFQREAKTSDALGELGIKCHLTDREKEALSGIAIGLTSKEVAQRMNIAPSTVKAFLRLIMIKTGAPNRAGIVAKLVAPADRGDTTADEFTWPAAG